MNFDAVAKQLAHPTGPLGIEVSFTGIDISNTMIVEAKRRNAQFIENGSVDLFLADVEAMPFCDEACNKVCTINTIYFWRNPAIALAEIYRVLAKDGLFILSYRPYIEGQSLDFSSHGFTEYQLEDIRFLVDKTDFMILDVKRQVEAPIEFKGQAYKLVSAYFLLQKTMAYRPEKQ